MGHFVANGSGGVQGLFDPMENRLRIPKPALPNDDYAPAQAAEPADMFFVVGNIPCEFIHPKLPVALGSGGILAPLVAVPEATVDEYHGPVPRQNNVRLARQVLDVKPETVACAVQQAADLPLRAGVCGPYLRHVPASFSFGQGVGHNPESTGLAGFRQCLCACDATPAAKIGEVALMHQS
jgi:hypothetical protein